MNDQLINASREERLNYLGKMYCHYPRLEELFKKVEACHKRSIYTSEPECLFIKGVSGVGKTSLQRKYEAKYPRQITDDGLIIPVLTVKAPVSATIRSLSSKMLEKLGDPAFGIGTTNNLSMRIHKFVKECKVELIILDEFQHFIDSESKKVLLNTANWLKELINETQVPVVLIGMPYSECIFHGSDGNQLARRFKHRASLEPFSWKEQESIKEFRTVLLSLDNNLPLPERSHLHSMDTAFRIMYATDGIMDFVMRLVTYACENAIERDIPCLNNELLGEAFDEIIKSVLGWKKNPFTESVKALDEVDKNYKPIPEPRTTSNKSKKNNKKIADILTTK